MANEDWLLSQRPDKYYDVIHIVKPKIHICFRKNRTISWYDAVLDSDTLIEEARLSDAGKKAIKLNKKIDGLTGI
jgi:hypothetical protein